MKNLFTGKMTNIWFKAAFLFMWISLYTTPVGYAATSEEQAATITLRLNNVSLATLFKAIENQSDYVFFYFEKIVDPSIKVDVNVKNKNVKEVLDNALSTTNLAYTIVDKQITIKEKDQPQKTNDKKAQVQVQGIVYDAAGQPLPGVNVRVKNTNIGTITSLDGDYKIAVESPSQVLIFSYIGYATQEIAAGDTKKLARITLSEDQRQTEEVIVIGYSTRTREKLINSVSTINSQQLLKSNVPNIENALSGRVSGVFSRQNTGEPGKDGGDVKIRGFGTALVVVDGIPGRAYDNLDPSEIESISVLKDASAAAVYGMQGANGVILVTTKRGSRNKPASLDISTRFGVQVPHNYPEAASSDTWQRLVTQYYANEKLISNPGATFTPEDVAIKKYRYNTNWYDEIIKNAPISQSNISVSGGTDKVLYFVSAGYLYQAGIWSTNSTSKNRFNLRSNLDVYLLDNLKMSVGIGGIINKLEYSGLESDEIARNMKIAAPNIPVRWDAHPKYYAFNGEGTTNPIAMADKDAAGYRQGDYKILNADFSLEYKFPFLEGLSVKGNIGYILVDEWEKNWIKNLVYMGYREEAGEYYQSSSASETDKASLTLKDRYQWTIVGQGFLNYKNSFGQNNINAGMVFEMNQCKLRRFNTTRDEFTSTVLDMMAGGNASKQVSNEEKLREYRSASLIGRFSYDYASRYFADFNFRYDGAQYFAKKWGFFPSFSLGWLMTNEEFMKSSRKTLNELKLRFSWGKLGDLSAATNYYNDYEQYYFQSGYVYPGSTLVFGDRTFYGLGETRNANPDFTWATSSMINGGVDFKFWNGLLGGSIDGFYRKRSGLPEKKSNDNAGALATYYNLNNDNTRGFDVTLNHANKIGQVSYTIDATVSWARAQYGHLEHGAFTSRYGEWKYNNENRWGNVRWGFNQIGQYQSFQEIANAPMHENANYNKVILPGDLKYEDWNGDGYIDENDKQPIGRTAYPELMYGVTVGLQWKGLDFTMFWQGGALSNFQIAAFDMAPFQEGKTFNNTWDYFKDSWYKSDYTDPNSPWVPGYFPAARDMFTTSINSAASTFWMWNGNYLRLKNVELGYSLPSQWLKKVKLKQLRIYVSTYNLFTFSAQKYFDPEQKERTFSFAAYPQLKSFNVGLNLKF